MTTALPDRMLVVMAVCAAVCVGGCYTEQRDIGYKPFLTGLPDVKTQTPASGDVSQGTRSGGALGSAAAPEDTLIVEEPDGSKRAVSRSGADVMAHVRRTLAAKGPDVFAAQELFFHSVLSEQTRLEFIERGLGPADAYARLKASEKDIVKLLERMPMAERSPFAVVHELDQHTHRVQLTGMAKQGLRYTGFDMTLEGASWVTVYKNGQPVMRDGKPVRRLEPSQWRLRWFVD